MNSKSEEPAALPPATSTLPFDNSATLGKARGVVSTFAPSTVMSPVAGL
jgi:hypothetical protein